MAGRDTFAFLCAVGMVVSGCVWISGSTDDGADGELVDALVDRTWVAIDYPLPRQPTMRFSRGDTASQVEVNGDDTCNHSAGPVTFDETRVEASEVFSTAVGCAIPPVTFIIPGTTFEVNDSELLISNPKETLAPSTRYLAWESLPAVTHAEMEGTYLHGTTVVRITEAGIETDECVAPWSADRNLVRIDFRSCEPQAHSEWWTDSAVWAELRRTPNGDLIISNDGDLIRLDRVEPGAAPQPTLAAFLGFAAGRTWVLNDEDYQSAWRPFVRFALHAAADVVPAAYGFNGCTRIEVSEPVHAEGVWTAVNGGWSLASPGGLSKPAIACPDDQHVGFATATYRITGDDQLEVVEADGTQHILQDAATRPAGVSSGPVERISGNWTLGSELATVDITTDPNLFRFGDCATTWTASDQWIQLAPTQCETFAPSPIAERLEVQIREGATFAVGMTDDLANMYLSQDLSIDTPSASVFRLTRIPAELTD